MSARVIKSLLDHKGKSGITWTLADLRLGDSYKSMEKGARVLDNICSLSKNVDTDKKSSDT